MKRGQAIVRQESWTKDNSKKQKKNGVNQKYAKNNSQINRILI